MGTIAFATDISDVGNYETVVIDSNSTNGEFNITIPSEVEMNQQFDISITKAVLPDNKYISIRLGQTGTTTSIGTAFNLYAADGSKDGEFYLYKNDNAWPLFYTDTIVSYYYDSPQPTIDSPVKATLQPKRDTDVTYAKDGEHSGTITFEVSVGNETE